MSRRTIHCERRDNGVAVMTLDNPDKAVNTLSPAVLDEFQETIVPLLEDQAVQALVVSSAKKSTFIAGADLDLLSGMDREQAAALSRRGNELLNQVAASPKPVVAAVHGAALGGGLEVALACQYLLASDDPATVLALPEVMLGLLPAAGGTQRLVDRIGLVNALPMLLTGKRIRAKKAYRIGLVDAVTTPGGITETAVEAARQLAAGQLSRRRRRPSLLDRLATLAPVRWWILRAARQQVQRQTRGLYPAPAAIIDCVATGQSQGPKAGLARESEHFGTLVTSPESRSLVWIFHAKNEIEHQTEEHQVRPVKRLAILGAGLMGQGVASVSLGLCPVVLRDISESNLAKAGKTINQGLGKQVRSGALRRIEQEQRRSRLLLTTQLEQITDADMVIEAVFEDLELKRRVVAEVEQRVGPETVIASNTSALPIAAISNGARHRERFLGLHYFSPVPKMPLLEIVAAEDTAPWALATARSFGTRQGKTCIVVKDGPGFYTTRILAPYLNEAVLLLEEGGKIEAVDRALKDFGFPVGPVALIDEVGIDVAAHVSADLGQVFTDRGLTASTSLPKLLRAGYEGRKNGHGFYRYPPAKKRGRKQPNQAIYAHLDRSSGQAAAAAQTIQDRLALLLVNEAAHCLQEEVISSARDGDIGAVFGLGFPPFRGGPFHYIDAVGAATIVNRLQELADRHGQRFQPAQILLDMSSSGHQFYRP